MNIEELGFHNITLEELDKVWAKLINALLK